MGEGLQRATKKWHWSCLLSSPLTTARGARLWRKSLPSCHPGGDSRDLPGVVMAGRSWPAPVASTLVLLSAAAGKMCIFHWLFLRPPMGWGLWVESLGRAPFWKEGVGWLSILPLHLLQASSFEESSRNVLTFLPRFLWNCIPELLCPI